MTLKTQGPTGLARYRVAFWPWLTSLQQLFSLPGAYVSARCQSRRKGALIDNLSAGHAGPSNLFGRVSKASACQPYKACVTGKAGLPDRQEQLRTLLFFTHACLLAHLEYWTNIHKDVDKRKQTIFLALSATTAETIEFAD